jgi:2-C-methyl-D-erythritol 4-phosphate cytidylyltransferase
MNSAIIVAAGRGTRMGPDVDKLFLEVAGQPVVAHTWKQFDSTSCIDEIVVVVRAGMESAFADLAAALRPSKPFRIVQGGCERQDSVWNGLEGINARAEIVAIQDGARPCTSSVLIEATVEAAREFGAAVAAQRVTDTIKESVDGQSISRHLDRQRLWSVQTPQTFQVPVIRRALTAIREKNLVATDDTAACEWIGQSVRLVESTTPNPKVTLPGDLTLIEILLQRGSTAATNKGAPSTGRTTRQPG